MPFTQESRGRDLRLDFFRGISLFIILIDHMRGNHLVNWTPGAFGFSDAACVFIFISGATAALAFGRGFGRAGWLAASARVMQRVWQIYIAQIAVVMIVAALPGIAQRVLAAPDYSAILKLDYLYGYPVDAIRGIVTLTYVPAYLDILPVYVVMLAMIPLAMLVARVSPRLVLPLSFALWLAARQFGWNLPADPIEDRSWFFNPFAWQFLFFIGFSLGMGWVRPPRVSRQLLGPALAFLVLSLLLRIEPIYRVVPGFFQLHDLAIANADKSTLDPLILVHFLALAMVVSHLLRNRLRWLETPAARPFVMAGQQSLSVFLGTVVLADIGGMAFDLLGRGPAAQIGVNAVAFVALVALAGLVAWFKSAPWKTVQADRDPYRPPHSVPAE